MQVIIIQATVSTKGIPPYMGVVPIYGVAPLLSVQLEISMSVKNFKSSVVIASVFSAFSPFFIMMEKNYCLNYILLQFPYGSNFFCHVLLSISTHNYVDDYPCCYFTNTATLNVTRRHEGYRYMLGRRNIAANDIVCPVFSIREIKILNRH